MTGRILQISISHSGVPKYPIPEGLVTPLGIEGDLHAHPRIHGGPRQALLLICAEAIETLIAKGYALFNGALGENLTTSGIDHQQMRIGQRYRIGEVFVELTKVRAPCATLDVYGPSIKDEIYDQDPRSPRFGMSGFYASVLQSGQVRTNDIITLVDEMV